ncbi:S-4TM family putative pore-forming effector [Streptomyces sp. NBC_00690]|uniref:S-4TM family putative pore-forming effector n=1 Tax=Streptomyces sp. NBC_00690 TaxID=2975808 RepID=UPI002E27D041|nr:S-4TM family putative pore-forming effector [Streptomyces sp. NBC_00690]
MAALGTSILQRQNDPDLLVLLKAASVSHSRAKRLALARIWLSLLLAATGVAGVFVPVLETPGTLLGLLWALAYTAGARFRGIAEIRRAALLQEMFDVRLLGLPWNTVLGGGSALPAQEVGRVARGFRASEERLHDYFYEATALQRPLDVLACQLQTLGWGARVRRRYATAITYALLVWCLGGVVTGLAGSMTVSDLLLHWFVPSLGLLLLGVETAAAQWDTAGAREHAQAVAMDAMRVHVSRGCPAENVPELLHLARQVQDVLLQTRLQQVRVPDWFFRRFQNNDREDFVQAMRELDRLAADPTA